MAAQKSDTTEARQAMASLCEAYWYPLYSFVRRRGHSPSEAADLVQGYFLKLLEKRYVDDVEPYAGRFRAFLLASVKNFLANERDRANTLKRGGRLKRVSLDLDGAEHRYRRELVELATPESLYERRWALTLLNRVLARLEKDLAEAGKSQRFRALQPFLVATSENSYHEAADALGISEGAARVAVHRLRKRYAQLLRAEAAETLVDPADAEDEIRHLFSALSAPAER